MYTIFEIFLIIWYQFYCANIPQILLSLENFNSTFSTTKFVEICICDSKNWKIMRIVFLIFVPFWSILDCYWCTNQNLSFVPVCQHTNRCLFLHESIWSQMKIFQKKDLDTVATRFFDFSFSKRPSMSYLLISEIVFSRVLSSLVVGNSKKLLIWIFYIHPASIYV
jgi:hypothetical protein